MGKSLFLVLLALELGNVCVFADQSATIDDARFIYSRLTGKPLNKKNPRYNEILSLTQQGKTREVAKIAMDDPSFISATARQWGSLMLTTENNPNLPLNDALATVVGSIRDNLDARLLLMGNYVYGADPRLGLTPPAPNSNFIYEKLEEQSKDLRSLLSYLTPQWNVNTMKMSAGVLTSRWWGETYYSAGTNRRAVKGTIETFLCQPIDYWKTPFLPTVRIRQDVDRAPSGEATTFQRECRSCHAPMDGLGGAFAYIDFVGDTLTMSETVMGKYLLHSDIYPEGYVTFDDSWINFLTTSKNKAFGWRGETSGKGISAFAQMVANSEAFSACMVKRTHEQICRSSIDLSDSTVKALASEFESIDGYKLGDLFVRVLLDSSCKQAFAKMGGDYEGN